MPLFDDCSLKKTLLILVPFLIVAQIDLVAAAGWPSGILSLLHLTAATDDLCRGVCAGIGASLDVAAAFQLVRLVAKRAMQADRTMER
jgi:hypothetical protein